MTDQYIAVAKLDEVPVDGRKRVEIEGKRIALFNVDGEVYAILDTCPHKKTAPLVRGTLDGLGIRCPNHGYRFDFKTGECNVSPQFDTQVFPVKIVGDDILISLASPSD